MSERLGPSDVYGWHVQRLCDLAPELSEAQLQTTTPACPAWTVFDLYRHLAGVSHDVVTPGATPSRAHDHTRQQVDERSDRSLDELCDELKGNVPGVSEFLERSQVAAPALDVWAHFNDIRGALALPRRDDGPVLAFALGMLAAWHRNGWAEQEAPTLRVVGERRDWVFGEGEPAATLSGSDYELARLLMGRRSQAQLLAMDWRGDPTAFVGHLSVFPPPVADLVD